MILLNKYNIIVSYNEQILQKSDSICRVPELKKNVNLSCNLNW